MSENLDHLQVECSADIKQMEYDRQFKIIMIGDTGTGKSCIL